MDSLVTGKARELLCYLLLHRGHPHSRETLAGHFWGDPFTAQSRKYSRKAIWQLQDCRRPNLPPAGFVAGLYADNDIKYGVHKAPANMVVQDAIRFEVMLNKAQQDVLNPEGINCSRFLAGRGHRLWGARMASSDPEWKYVNLRRYFAYLEHSVDRGTQWVVFENNSELLWANVRTTVEDFLFNEWKSNHLMGDKPEQAYFVRCDRSTMTQNDIDNGRLICLIGVAPVRPAEFVIFRIGQWVGSRA